MKRRTRRWGRILFNTLTAISLLLAIATAGLWVISNRYFGVLTWLERPSNFDTPNRAVAMHHLELNRGSIRYVVERFAADVPSEWFYPSFAYYPQSVGEGATNYGCDFGVGLPRLISLDCSLWIPSLAFIILPSARTYRWTRELLALRAGHCPACGYDMRASPAKCSECGHEVKLAAGRGGEPFTSGEARG